MKVHRLFEDTGSDYAEKIKGLCAPYLAYGLKQPLLRGLPKSTLENIPPKFSYTDGQGLHQIRMLAARRGRTPTAISPAVQAAADKFFKAKFGWNARADGTFATSSPQQAKWFGQLNYFIPIGEFGFVWSPNIFDLFRQLPKKITSGLKVVPGTPEYDEALHLLGELLDKAEYTDRNLRQAVAEGHEITFNCDKYFMISASNASPSDDSLMRHLLR